MNFRRTGTAICAVAIAYASAAQAGDEPQFQTAPDWVEIAQLDAVEVDETKDLAIYDQQTRIEEGERWDYHDRVYRISAATDLSRAGTLTFQWLPDKGDLIVHEISILRDGEVVSTLRPKADLGIEAFQHVHNAVGVVTGGQLYVLCYGWNPGCYAVLELVVD